MPASKRSKILLEFLVFLYLFYQRFVNLVHIELKFVLKPLFVYIFGSNVLSQKQLLHKSLKLLVFIVNFCRTQRRKVSQLQNIILYLYLILCCPDHILLTSLLALPANVLSFHSKLVRCH